MSNGNDGARARARLLRRVGAQQEQLRVDMAAAERWGTHHPQQFAGTWFDNDDAEAATGPVRVALGVVSGSDPEPAERLRQRLRYPDRLVVRACEHSLRELDELRAEIVSGHAPPRQPSTGTYVSTISTDLQTNTVHVTLSTDDEAAAERLRQQFPGRPLRITLGVVVEPAGRRTR